MNMPKEEVIAGYTHIGVGRKRSIYTVKDIKPAGNWQWELEVEDEEFITVIIGWANMADADKAEKAYESNPEFLYKRWGNATAYIRASRQNSGIPSLSTFTMAAGGSFLKDKKGE